MPAPLHTLLAIVILHSLGTAVVWHVIYFVGEQSLNFSKTTNLIAAITAGAVYTAAAFYSGPITRNILHLSTRATLIAALLGSTLIAAAQLAQTAAAFWAFIIIYPTLTGFVWPTIEAFLAGGRTGKQLRNASGRFNISWSTATFIGAVIASPFVEQAPAAIFTTLAVIHATTIILVLRLAPNPPSQPVDPAALNVPTAANEHTKDIEEHRTADKAHDADHPPEHLAKPLLTAFRWLNFAAYALVASLTPILPHMLTSFGAPIAWLAALGGVWMGTRVATFVLFERWHGWHASKLTPFAAVAVLALGYVGSLAANSTETLVAALGVLGAGAGIAYAGSIYYSVHTGAGNIDAGGKHEGFIGLGYTLGPLLGLAVVTLAIT